MSEFRVRIAFLLAVLLCAAARAELPARQSNIGDSTSQAALADGWPADRPELSWVQGTSSDVYSVYLRYLEQVPSFTQRPESVSGAEMVGTYLFGPADINGTDCLHPSVHAQRKLACMAWASNPDGAGNVSDCF